MAFCCVAVMDGKPCQCNRYVSVIGNPLLFSSFPSFPFFVTYRERPGIRPPGEGFARIAELPPAPDAPRFEHETGAAS